MNAPHLPAGQVHPDDWATLFPALRALDDPAWREVQAAAQVLHVPPGTTVFHDGDRCTAYLLVLSGSVRVNKVSEGGREILLYRVQSGEACVLTTSCLLAGDAYPASGTTESEVMAVAIPAERFDHGLRHSEGFRRFVFAAYGQRISDLILLIEGVAFGRTDARLAQCLLRHASRGAVLECTHQDLAVELGTAREVVSRQLKEFERRHWVQLQRGRIEVVDTEALAAVVRRHPA